MPRDSRLLALVPRLLAATYFEDAAAATLDVMFASVEAAIAHGAFAGRVRVLRGAVHLRPEDSYQRLFGLERATGAMLDGLGYISSGSVWQWIEHHRHAVSIDVARGRGLPADATRERMLERDATHVHAVPLCAVGGRVDGMILLEASCRFALSPDELWAPCRDELDTLAGAAGAFIAARGLPVRPTAPASPDAFLPVVGARMAHLVELLRAFAPRDDTLLLSGPTGSGKSRLARWCHAHSPRHHQPFEVLDLLGVPEELQLAELFGWRRGAFTGAIKDNPGAIARAAGGTLFIDEIDKLSLRAQAGLLRFIEDRVYRALGDDAGDRRTEVRLVIGTNIELRAAVRAGAFREDLYYRINVLPVRLPPLSERLDELPRWADYMLQRRHVETGGAGTVRFEPAAMALLAAAPWPGNLRQLDNIVRRTYALLLAGQRDAAGDAVVQRHHVEHALMFDGDADPGELAALAWRVAAGLAREAARRGSSGAPLALDVADGLRGLVLAAAVQQCGGADAAFMLFGQDALVKSRNHQRTLKRELARARELVRALGDGLAPELVALLDGQDDA